LATTGNRIRVMEMLQGDNSTIGNLISESGRGADLDRQTGEFVDRAAARRARRIRISSAARP